MSVSLGVRRFLFLAAVWLGPHSATATEWMPLRSFASQAGLTLESLPEQDVRLTGSNRTVELRPGRREIRVDGLRVFLGWPLSPATDGKPAGLHMSDVERVLLPLLTPTVELKVRRPLHIVLDPGHGGKDDGARSGEPIILEKHLSLKLASLLGERLLQAGLKVTHTRTEDTFVALGERPSIANSVEADLFVSLHFNSAADLPTVRGIETYVLTPRYAPSTNDSPEGAGAEDPRRVALLAGNSTDRANALLGFALHSRLVRDLQVADRGLKRARFAVLRDLEMPGVLVEGAYLSSPEDAALARDDAWLHRLADTLFRGILDYSAALERAGVT